MGASLALLRAGGLQVVTFLLFATAFCFVQNFLGIAIARGFGQHPLLGVMAGSVTLVGGPATGLAFAPLLEEAGLFGAGTLALTSATFGIVCGGLAGTPIGTWLIRKFGLTPSGRLARTPAADAAEEVVTPHAIVVQPDREDAPLIMNMIVLAVAMGIGSILSGWFKDLGLTLPAYIGAMMAASVLRNIDDASGWFRIDPAAMDFVGGFALNIFLVVALMDLKLWQLAGQALPLFVILAAQVVVISVFALTVSFRLMGRDYDSAVMASGFVGFALGTTANAVANMRALVTKYGPAPRAFLVVPLVGAFFIDFANAIIITFFVNWMR
jgi:glutamate:Na+ symporter, ESS family